MYFRIRKRVINIDKNMEVELLMKKVLLINLLMALLFIGCINKDEKVDEAILREKSFKKIIADIKSNEIQDTAKKSTGRIMDGVYNEVVGVVNYYNFNYLANMTEAEINLLISDMEDAISSVPKRRAYIIISNRALAYEKLSEYSGPQDFSDNAKSVVATDVFALSSVVMDKETGSTAKADGSGSANMLEFSFDGISPAVSGLIEGSNIDVVLKSGLDLSALVATFKVSEGATVKVGGVDQVSGTTANDFSGAAVEYVVTSNDLNTSNTYTVNILQTSIGTNYPATGAFSPVDQANWGIARYELGANVVGDDVTFAVYSKNATKMLLEIYNAKSGEDATYDCWMEKGTDNIWRAKLAQVPAGTYYAFRAWGPNWTFDSNWVRGNSAAGFIADVDANGNRFNPNKVLYDIYAKELSHDKSNPITLNGKDGSIYGTGATLYEAVEQRNIDTGHYAPKAVVISDSTSYGVKPGLDEKDAIIYEAHVRGITKHPSSISLGTILNGIPGFEAVENVPDELRGTYAGAAYFAKYLKALGYTTIELLPVHETDNDHNPDDAPGGNYWGYMTYGFFAPDRRYAYDQTPGGPTKEFKQMVKEFHDQGLEVYIDVVYNHTGEGGTWDGTGDVVEITGFRGFDNEQYYALVDGDPKSYWQTTGCGNNFDASNEVVRTVIKDSLKYWINEMGVDGFRFDLAPVLGRDQAPNYVYNPNAQLLKDIADMTTQYNVEMIAEAWDTQWPAGYQVSNFPAKWGEWNGIYRDVVRKLIAGTASNKIGGYPSFADVFNGSYDLAARAEGSGHDHTGFYDNGGPQKSVNFLVAHDGFTLADLVSYNDKNNSQAWPFGESDGGSGDDASDTGGDQDLRRQQLRNLWTILFLSRGVPMSVWGDEFARTQNGNTNPYNLDSVATWNNYNMINTDSPHTVATEGGGIYRDNIGTDGNANNINAIFSFVSKLTKIRKDHHVFRQNNYNVEYKFKKEDGVSDLEDSSTCFWVKVDGSSVGDHDFLIMLNMHTAQVEFAVPNASTDQKWVRVLDTSNWAETDDNIWEADIASEISAGNYGVNSRSIVVLEEVPSDGVEIVGLPQFSLGSGVYDSNKTLTITSATNGATIKYSINGGTEATYTAPINLTANGGNGKGGYEIKARATKSGLTDSKESIARYAIAAQVNKTYDAVSDVMLQGFHWESKNGDGASKVWYEIISEQSSTIKDSFEWVWFPPASLASGASGQEGYIPTELNNLDSEYGTEVQLKQAIVDISPTKAIADIVINHRSGASRRIFLNL
jgi:glycogen operon protein